MAQTFATITQSAQSVTTVLGHLDDRTTTLRTCFSGSSAPGSPVVGQYFLNTSATPHRLYIYADIGAGNAWVEVGLVEQINQDIDMGFTELIEARVENRASAATVSAGRDGHIYLLTGDGELYFIDQAVDNATKKILAIQSGSDTQEIQIPLANFQLDATNPPTVDTKGTTPTVRGLLFDAANELAVVTFRVPTNWSGDADLTVRLVCVLDQAETNGDDIDWSGNVRVVDEGGDVSATSTATAASTTDIGTNSADGKIHYCDIVIDYDDANNPVSKGSWVFLEINRTDLAEVGGVIVIGASLVYTVDGAVQ